MAAKPRASKPRPSRTKKVTASKKKTRTAGLLRHLEALDRDGLTDVILGLVAAHPELQQKAEGLAGELLGSSNVDDLAAAVESALADLDMRVLGARSGRQRDGYVDPYDEASTMLDEALEPFLRQLRDRIELGRLDDAARIARGIVAGLDAVDGNYDTTDSRFLSESRASFRRYSPEAWCSTRPKIASTRGWPVALEPVR